MYRITMICTTICKNNKQSVLMSPKLGRLLFVNETIRYMVGDTYYEYEAKCSKCLSMRRFMVEWLQ